MLWDTATWASDLTCARCITSANAWARHMQETGENLLQQAFEQVTDEQLEAFSIKTGKQRMDSTLLACNIRQMGRVQLLVTVLQRVWRMLSEEDQQHYFELFAPYLKGHAGQYVYRLKKEEMPSKGNALGKTCVAC
jgi:ABC-type transporter MlaC component